MVKRSVYIRALNERIFAASTAVFCTTCSARTSNAVPLAPLPMVCASNCEQKGSTHLAPFTPSAWKHKNPQKPSGSAISSWRYAINWLLEEAYIEEKDGCLVWREKPAFAEKSFPVLQVANQIEVILNVPEHVFFLTVPNGFSTAVIDYLSSYFHKGDILFIPMGCHIMCVNVLPEKVLLGLEEKASPHDIPCLE